MLFLRCRAGECLTYEVSNSPCHLLRSPSTLLRWGRRAWFVIVRLITKMGQMSHDTAVLWPRDEMHSQTNYQPTIKDIKIVTVEDNKILYGMGCILNGERQ